MSHDANWPTYRYDEVETPYAKRGQALDHGLGLCTQLAYRWRLVCLVALLCCVALMGAVVYQVQHARVRVLVLQVLPSGAVKSTGVFSDAARTHDPQIIHAVLERR